MHNLLEISRVKHRLPALLLLVTAGLLIAGCHRHATAPAALVQTTSIATVKHPITNPTKFVRTATTPDGLVLQDVSIGSGPKPKPGDLISLSYVGWLANGKEFDSSTIEKQPLVFTLGERDILAGLNQAVSGMRLNGVRQVIIPAQLAYGKKGDPKSGIPANAQLTFLVHLLSVTPAPAAVGSVAGFTDVPTSKGLRSFVMGNQPLANLNPTQAGPVTDPKKFVDVQKHPDGLIIQDLVIGKGPLVKPGDLVTANYVGWLSTGQVFDSSAKHHTPLVFKLGGHSVIEGWEQGVAGMHVGGIRQLIIPPALAYGAAGAPMAGIGPNATLTFRLHVLSAQQ